jgi:hypothetical protein
LATTYLGLNLISSSSPDYEGGISPIALLSANFTSLDGKSAVEVESASGAIGITQGAAVITKSSAPAVMTLAAPTTGLPAAAGNNGQILTIVTTTAQAHTVTTPANKLNGASTTLTFAAAIGGAVQLIAYNGVWYTLTLTGVTVS